MRRYRGGLCAVALLSCAARSDLSRAQIPTEGRSATKSSIARFPTEGRMQLGAFFVCFANPFDLLTLFFLLRKDYIAVPHVVKATFKWSFGLDGLLVFSLYFRTASLRFSTFSSGVRVALRPRLIVEACNSSMNHFETMPPHTSSRQWGQVKAMLQSLSAM